MCNPQTYGQVRIKQDSGYIILKTIDSCITPIVQALNDAGIATVASCCGHGEKNGIISLADGREILIARNYEEARLMESIIRGDRSK